MEDSKILLRSKTDRVIGGVCGGLGNYFDIDPVIFRLIFILLVIFGGSGIVVYILMWILIPEEGETRSKDTSENIKEGANKMAKEVQKVTRNGKNTRLLGGMIIIAVGIIFLIQEFFPFWNLSIRRLWPLIIVAIGVAILSKGDDIKTIDSKSQEKKEK